MPDETPDITPLYVRLPAKQAEKLHRVAKRAGIAKKDVVSELITGLDDGEGDFVTFDPKRMIMGRHSFRPPEPPADVLTPAQAAELLQVPEATVVELAEAGELPGRKLGEEWRFAREALVAWLGGA